MIELLFDSSTWIAFFTLTLLELVLGIDNIVFISILVDKLPAEIREKTRRLGLLLAMFMRIGLLVVLSWLIGLTEPLLSLFGQTFSGRDLILIGGGLFLLWKSAKEIREQVEETNEVEVRTTHSTFTSIMIQIILIDMVFSLDSIITAVGMVDELAIMVAAVVTSVALMMAFAGPIGRFVSDNPTVKMLALAFLFLIGVVLIADGLGHHIPKGYIYFAMAFTVCVEMLNLISQKKKNRPQAG